MREEMAGFLRRCYVVVQCGSESVSSLLSHSRTKHYLITFLDMCCCGHSPSFADVSEGGLSSGSCGPPEAEWRRGKDAWIKIIKSIKHLGRRRVNAVAEAIRT
jgi:hypothetical protein